MADLLALDDFTPALGEAFALDAGGTRGLELRLVEARSLGDQAFKDRTPFALLFRGPREPVLAQAMYRLTHQRLGALDIFIVPVGRGADGVDYEAIFT